MIRTIVGAVLLAGVMAGPSTAQEAVNALDNLPDSSDYFMSSDMKDFFVDGPMTTMKPHHEMKAAFEKMSPQQKEKLRAACAADTEKMHEALCKAAS